MDAGGYQSLAIFLIFAAVFAVWGGVAHLLSDWENIAQQSWQRTTGAIMVSVMAAWVVGLLLREEMPERPGLLLVGVLSASWLGARVLDRLANRFLAHFNGGH